MTAGSNSHAQLGEVPIAILAGGLGTRLRSVVPDRPKLLAPIGGRLFIDVLLDWLEGQGARRVVLLLGHRAEQVTSHLAAAPRPGLAIETVVEPEPLGTAGAVAFGRAQLGAAAIVMNGDTFVDCDLDGFATSALSDSGAASLVAVHQADTSRYGRVEVRDGRLVGFQEKLDGRPGLVNAGIYFLKQAALAGIHEIKSGSIERDFFAQLPKESAMVWQTRGRFIDIGTPESLAAAGDLLRPVC